MRVYSNISHTSRRLFREKERMNKTYMDDETEKSGKEIKKITLE
jgi:hypothetical protein